MKKLLTCALTTVLFLWMGDGAMLAQRSADPATVVASKVVHTRRARMESFVGTFQAIRRSTVGSAVEGRVVQVTVEPGDPARGRVDEATSSFIGEPLVQLRTETLDIEIGAAEIQLKLSSQALEELKLSVPKNMELLAAKEAEARARLGYSTANYERLRKLANQSSAISQLELEQSRSQFLADQQAAAAAAADLQRLTSTRELLLLQAQSRVAASRQELKRLQDIKSKYSIRAPFAGFVTQKLTEVGAWVSAGDPLIEVVQLDPIEMIINVPQFYLSRLQQSMSAASRAGQSGLSVQVSVDGIEKTLSGTVKRIVPQADLKSRTFPVRVVIGNPSHGENHFLQPGMLGRARLTIGEQQEMLMVKKDALVLNERNRRVFKIVTAEGAESVVGIDVTTGASWGDMIEISGDIHANDRVVLFGNERLRTGQRVEVAETVEPQLPEG